MLKDIMAKKTLSKLILLYSDHHLDLFYCFIVFDTPLYNPVSVARSDRPLVLHLSLCNLSLFLYFHGQFTYFYSYHCSGKPTLLCI